MESFLTLEGRSKIKKDLQEFKEIKRPQIAERIREAKEMGDLSENTEYTTAKDEQAWVETEIKRLENLLRSARIIDNNEKGGSVGLGSTVKLKTGGEMKTYMIVGSEETDPLNGRISHQSPLGQALLDKRINEKVTIRTPKGETTFVIVGVK